MMAKKTTIVKTDEDNIDELSSMMAKGFLDILNAQVKVRGDHDARELYTHFIAKLVGGIVYNSLTDLPGDVKGKEAQYNWTVKSFDNAKDRMQEAVSAGFQLALTKYTGVRTEYYCQIKPVPEPVNKQPC